MNRTIVIAISILIFALAAVFLHAFLNRCTACDKLNVKEAHRVTCPKGHVYYDCQPDKVSEHKGCYVRLNRTPNFDR